MEEPQALLAELEQVRERATGLIRAKLSAIAEQLREAAARAESDLDMVVPPDPEAFFPLTQVGALLPGPPSAEPTRTATDLELFRALDGGRAQSEVLQEMLRRLEPWCGRRAVVVFRDGRVTGWAGSGVAAEAVRGWQGELSASPALTSAAKGTPTLTLLADENLLASWLTDADRALLVPMSLRGNVVGALIATPDGDTLAVEEIQLVTYVTGLLLETLSVRPQVPTPALGELADHVGAAPAEHLVADEEIAEHEGVPAEAEAEEQRVVMETEEVLIPEVAEPEEEAEAEIEVGEGVEGEVHQFDDAGATVQLKVPVTPIVRPRTAEDERRHEEARRFAKLLVSEIRLYNEQAVVEGKQSRDIYQRLKEDIDRSREMYEQRVPSEVRAESNYFFDELVRILGDGDPDALGL